MKVVTCPQGHPVGEIRGDILHMDACGPLRSTEQGFVPSCPICGAALREWTVPWWRPLFRQIALLRATVEARFGKLDRQVAPLEYFRRD